MKGFMVDRMDGNDVIGLLPLSLLDRKEPLQKASQNVLDDACHQIEAVLSGLGIPARLVSAVLGPVLAWYEIELAEGVEPVKVTIHARDFAKALSVMSFRVVEDVAGPNRLGFEVPNTVRERIFLSDVLTAGIFTGKESVLPVALGKTVSGSPVVADLAGMPHLLIGSDSSAENVGFLHAVILSLLCKQASGQMRLLLVDVKTQVFSVYQGIPHLLVPVITEVRKGLQALDWAIQEMERRFLLFERSGVTDFAGYQQSVSDGKITGQNIPRIVIAINGYPDLSSNGREVELLIARLALRGHIAGIHLVLATAQVSFDTVTDLIKLNVPTRVSFKVRSMTDSRRMVGQNGAEALLGQGDMLYLSSGSETVQRIHGVSVSDEEVARVTAYFCQQGRPDGSCRAIGGDG